MLQSARPIRHDAGYGDVVVADDPECERRVRLRAALVRHLRRYPLAGDTPEGMLACWLQPDDREGAAHIIGEVVDEMVSAGELRAERLPGGVVLYIGGPALDAPE